MDILLFLLQAIATVSAANSASGYWGADNRVVPTSYSGNGRFYQREVVHEPEYYYPDEDYSNQIGRYPVPEAPVYHPSTRHRNHHSTSPYVSPNWRRRVHVGSGHGRNTHHQYYQDVSSQSHRGSHQKGAHHQGSAAAPPPKSQHAPRITTGLYRSSQWGSAAIPYKGAKVHVPVLSGSKKAYRGTITTTVFSPQQGSSGAAQNSLQPQTSATRVDPGVKEVHDAPDYTSQKLCVRCPGDRAVVAAKGTSFVLVETPAVKPCHNSAVTRAKLSEIRVESLFGPQPGTTVQEGSYSMLIRLIHDHEQLQMCKYRITVIVRKCPPLHLAPHLRVQCSLNNVWGSKCSFACHQGYQLLGSNSTECGDKLKWTNSSPRCVAVRACPLPMSPEHGHLSCETPGNAVSHKSDLLEEGSICRYECDTGYSIPGFQSHLSSIKCWAGSWNSTVDPSCQAQSAVVSYATQADAGQRRRSIRHKHHRLRASCKNNPCQGGGTCFNGPHPNRPTLCICPPNREGDFCERAKCEEELCKNGGRCVVMGNSSFCYCPPGFTGPTCQQPIEHSNATQHADSKE